MAKEIQYADLISQAAPEGLTRWAMQQGKLGKEYLIYKACWHYDPLEDRNHPAVEVRCSACNGKFVADKVDACGCRCGYAPAPFGFRHPETEMPIITGDHALCPICGAETEMVHVGQIRYGIDQSTYVAVPGRVKIPGKQDRFVVTDWRINRNINKDGFSAFCLHPWTAWVVEERKVIRLMGYQKCASTLSYRSLSQRKTFLDDFGRADLIWPTQMEDILGTTAENSKLDRYIQQGGVCLVAYLALWRKKPAIENLVMHGYGKLVDELINEDQTVGTYKRKKGIPTLNNLDWKEKKPHRMLGMSKEEFRGPGRELSANDWRLLIWARKAGIPAKLPEDLSLLRYIGMYGGKALLELVGSGEFLKAARWIQKNKSTVGILRDYRRDAQTAGWDMNDPNIRWPKNLNAAHDRAAEAARTKVKKESVKLFQDRYKALSKYTASFDGILIRPCKNQTELTREGKELQHCVAGYAKQITEGRTAIFFIRHEAEPDKPWYTLEFDEIALKIRQNRGFKNDTGRPGGPDPEAVAFGNRWMEWIRAGAKRDDDGNPVLPKKHEEKESKTA